MTFHPRMYATVRGFRPVENLRSVLLDRMTIDYWKVEGMANARGHYVSMHPRFVFFLDERTLLLRQNRVATPCKSAASYIPAGLEVHGEIESPGPLRHLDIHMPLKTLREIAGTECDLSCSRLMSEARAIAPYLRVLATELVNRERDDQHIEALVRLLVREFFFAAEKHRHRVGEARIPLEQLHNFVLKNLGRRISVDELAAEANLSRSHFNRLFRSELDLSPHRWVQSIRIKQAKTLLIARTRYAEIAGKTGFADQAHFNRAFKAETGQTPGRWMIEHTDDQYEPNVQYNTA